MNLDVLNGSDVIKIQLTYVGDKGVKIKENVRYKYLDKSSCYFSCELKPDFNQPRNRTKAEIVVFTSNGRYSTSVKIKETTRVLYEAILEVETPKKWNFTQYRAGCRKNVDLGLKIKFADGQEIATTTKDLSVGGLSYISDSSLTTVQKGFEADCTIDFSKNYPNYLTDNELNVKIKFVRQAKYSNDYGEKEKFLYCFKFTNLTPNKMLELKTFLIRIS